MPPSTPPRSQATQAATVPPHPAPRDTESNYVSPSPRSEDTLGNVADNGTDLSELEGLLSPARQPGELGWLGPYRVLKILGQGGMGVVFLAEDPALERRVALKAMLPKIARNASAKDRFLREARAAAKLKHEHIVAIHQVGEDRGIPFLAIEFLEGEALDDCLKREGNLPIPEVARIGRQIAEGLAAAHEQHLIHRDIKPANIWLERRKGRKATVVKILDFGLAKQTNDQHHLTQSGMIIGTPAYMPPEQAGAGAVDHRADLYSLGVVLYKMVTGEVPFTGRDTMALLSALALQAPTPPVERNPNVPDELNALILKLLAKKPEDRPQSAEEVAAALEAIAAPTEIASPSVAAKLAADPNRTQGFASAVTTQTANAPRKRWPMALVGLLLLGFATMATLYFSGLIRIGTSDGDFVLDTDDPDFAFSVSKDKVLLDDKKTKRQYHLKVLAQKDGQYELEMTDADAGLTFHSKTITIRRGDKVALKAWFERTGAQAGVEPKALPPTFKNSIGMEFVKVPRGTGWLGGGGGRPGDKKVEFEHDFYLGKYEVTQEEWEKITGLNPSRFSRTGEGKNGVKEISDAELRRFPVDTVSWDDCQLFVERLNKQMKESGWVYRLPTETEWEYAYRGGPVERSESAFHFYFEKPSNELREADANLGQLLNTTRKVGSYKSNRLGLYDMLGNVGEWCEDAVPNPKNTSDKSYRVSRGGSWWNGKNFLIKDRYPAPPNYRLTGGGGTMGLRLARVLVVKDIAKIEPPPPDPVVPVGKSGEVEIDLPPWTLPKDAPKPALAPLTKEAAQQVQAAWVKHLKRAAAVQENSVGMKLALIPPGEFDTTYTEPNSASITPELIRRRLRISQPFDLGVTEVTVAQFRRFVEETKYVTDAEKSGKGGSDGAQQKPEWTWKNPGPFKLADTLPVTQVSWNDANAFCEWLSKKEKVRYRLPTEAEWEFACRAGSVSFHGVCDKEFELTQHAWVRENGTVGGAQPRPVGNWHANPFGLFDMIGNAWEWCADGGDRGSGERTHAVDPWGYFVYPNVRGPGYDIPAKEAHPAFRRRLTYDHARSSVGFRVLRQLSPEPPPGPLDRPLLVRRNGPLFRDALTQRPTPIPGLRSWSVELAGHGHANRDIQAIAWSPKGDVIATGDYRNPVVRLWDRQGKLERVLPDMGVYPAGLTFSPSGQWLASVPDTVNTGSADLRIANTTTGVILAKISGPISTNRSVFSPDGKILAVQRGSSLETLDLLSGRILGRAGGISTPNGDEMIAWSPDGKTIVTAYETGFLNFHSAPYLESMKSVPAFKKARMRVSWSPDGKWLAVSPNDPADIWIYDAQSREVKLKLNGNQGAVRSLGWSKDSKRLLSGGSNGFLIWDALAGKELLRSTGGGGPAAWSPDETEVAVGGQRLQIFDAATGLLKRTPVDVGRAVGNPHIRLSLSAQGKRLFLRSELGNPIDIVDPLTGRRQDRWDKLSSGRLSASPANDLLAVYSGDKDKNLYLVDAATGKQLRELKGHTDAVICVAWSPDGKWLASGGRDRILRIWNTAEATLKHELPGHEGDIVGLGCSPDGQRLASLARDKTLRLWDPLAGKHRSTHNDPPEPFKEPYPSQPLVWAKDGHSLWVSLHGSVVQLDPATGKWSRPDATKGIPARHPDLALSPAGDCLMAQTENNFGLCRIDLKQKSKRLLPGISTGGQWHPDSRRFLTGLSGIGWQRGYDAETLEPLGTLVPFLAGDNWLVVGPTGHYAGPKNIEDHLVYIAQTETGEYITLTPAEFEKKYGWRNDPAKARLLKLE